MQQAAEDSRLQQQVQSHSQHQQKPLWGWHNARPQAKGATPNCPPQIRPKVGAPRPRRCFVPAAGDASFTGTSSSSTAPTTPGHLSATSTTATSPRASDRNGQQTTGVLDTADEPALVGDKSAFDAQTTGAPSEKVCDPTACEEKDGPTAPPRDDINQKLEEIRQGLVGLCEMGRCLDGPVPRIPRNNLTTAQRLSSRMKRAHTDSSQRLGRFASSRQDCRAKQQDLMDCTMEVSRELGAGHSFVEDAKREVQRLRNKEEELRLQECVQWHETNVANALQKVETQGADISELEDAIKLVRQSELGPGHRLATDGKDHALRLRKAWTAQSARSVASRYVANLQSAGENASVDPDGLATLAESIRQSAGALGAGHAAVNAAVKVYQRTRNEMLFAEHDVLVNSHFELMEKAKASNDPDAIQDRIEQTLKSPLGPGHPIVIDGKRYLLSLRKRAQREHVASARKTSAQCLREVTLRARQSLGELEEKMRMASELTPHLDPCLDKSAVK